LGHSVSEQLIDPWTESIPPRASVAKSFDVA
jgi:hypothetical protein